MDFVASGVRFTVGDFVTVDGRFYRIESLFYSPPTADVAQPALKVRCSRWVRVRGGALRQVFFFSTVCLIP